MDRRLGPAVLHTNISDPTLLSRIEIRCYALDAVQNNLIELITSVVMLVSAVALLWYWFRYACLLILTAETPHDYTEEVASVNELSFPEVRSRLRRHDTKDLDSLQKCLERDFAIIAYLLEHTPKVSSDARLEDALLRIHYRTMSVCFRLTRSFLREVATQALEEMSLVVAHLANRMGERSAAAY